METMDKNTRIILRAVQTMYATDGRINEQLKRFDDNEFLVDKD